MVTRQAGIGRWEGRKATGGYWLLCVRIEAGACLRTPAPAAQNVPCACLNNLTAGAGVSSHRRIGPPGAGRELANGSAVNEARQPRPPAGS
jgi:hypothetical protein